MSNNILKTATTYYEDGGIVSFAESESSALDSQITSDSDSNTFHVVETKEEQPKRSFVPGSEAYMDELDEELKPPPPPPKKPTDWQNDRDVQNFMQYIVDSYPARIPKHNGKSIVGAERAITWLTNLSKEISEAVRRDETNVLDDIKLEEIRVSIMKDILVLKEHVKKLNKKFKGTLKKTAGFDDMMDFAEEIELAYASEIKSELKKEAAIPRMTLTVSPFERAISGIIINSVVSSGKPFEEVYEFLKKKYDLNDREELAILQVIMDSGFYIFKDRGTISSEKEKDSKEMHGIEFIKNYFA